MDSESLTEKKWFVYLGDHHEGPFSIADLQPRMEAGQITAASYVWAEGMADWAPISQIPAFQLSPASGASSRANISPSSAAITSAPLHDGSSLGSAAVEPAVTVSEPAVTLAASSESQPLHREALQPEPAHAPAKKKSSRFVSLLLWLVLIALGTTAYYQGYLDPLKPLVQPYLLRVSAKFPILFNWISPIPSLPDVTPQDYADLRSAAATPLQAKGPPAVRAAVALSLSDLANPVFYVATNLPDGAKFDVYVEGDGDTLLNQLSFSGQRSAQTTQHLAKTEPLRYPDGKPVPRGQYTVYVAESPEQSPEIKSILDTVPAVNIQGAAALPKSSKIFVYKTVFLGGPKDTIYAGRLKEFHDKLMEKAKNELAEIGQFSATLDKQLSETDQRFDSLASKKGGKFTRPAALKKTAWRAFDSHWSAFMSKLNESFQKWTPQAIENDYFYGILYKMTQTAAASIQKVHDLQSSYFTSQVDLGSFEIQMGEAVSQAQNEVTALTSKFNQAQQMSPSPNGMPRKEGL